MSQLNSEDTFDAAGKALERGDRVRAEMLYRELAAAPALSETVRARAQYALSTLLYSTGRAAEAVPLLEAALAVFQHTQGREHTTSARIMILLARCLIAIDNFTAGLPLAREAEALLAGTRDPNDPDLAMARYFLSSAEYQCGNLDEAERLTRLAMTTFRHIGGREADLSSCLNNLGRIYEERGDLEQGILFHRQSVELHKQAFGEIHPQTAFSLGNLGVALAAAGSFREAASMLTQCLECYRAAGITEGREIEGYQHNLKVCRSAIANMAPETASPSPTPPRTTPQEHEEQRRKQLLDEIIERELTMFLEVRDANGICDCQQRPDVFRRMRTMMHAPHNAITLTFYLDDLDKAARGGRNLMVEKYARMDNLIPPLTDNPLVDFITDAEVAFQAEAGSRYPHLVRNSGEMRRYLRCELETLSDNTLASYAEEIRKAREEGRNLALERYTLLCAWLGHPDLASCNLAMQHSGPAA